MRLALITSLMATACASSTVQPEPAGGWGQTPCYGSTRDWRAWIDAMPGVNRLTLNVTGVVTTPTSGHRSSLTLGPTLRSEPPQQIVNLEIRSQSDIATTAVVTEEVRGNFPALPRYGAVIIRCNGQEVGRVSPVETAH